MQCISSDPTAGSIELVLTRIATPVAPALLFSYLHRPKKKQLFTNIILFFRPTVHLLAFVVTFL